MEEKRGCFGGRRLAVVFPYMAGCRRYVQCSVWFHLVGGWSVLNESLIRWHESIWSEGWD